MNVDIKETRSKLLSLRTIDIYPKFSVSFLDENKQNELVKACNDKHILEEKIKDNKDDELIDDHVKKLFETTSKIDNIYNLAYEKYINNIAINEEIIKEHIDYIISTTTPSDILATIIDAGIEYYVMHDEDNYIVSFENALDMAIFYRLVDQHFACDNIKSKSAMNYLNSKIAEKSLYYKKYFSDEVKLKVEEQIKEGINDLNKAIEDYEKDQASILLYESPAESLYHKVPASMLVNLSLDMFSYGKDKERLQELKSRRNKIKHDNVLSVATRELDILDRKINKKTTVTASTIKYDNGKESFKLQFDDINKLTASNKTLKKLLIYTFSQIHRQALNSNKNCIINNCIEFTINDLIENELYTNTKSAKRAFKDNASLFKNLSLEVEKGTDKWGMAVLFPAVTIDGNTCKIYINDLLPWGELLGTYTIMPKYAYSLPIKEFDLMYHIVYLARQHGKDIQEKGYFTISLRSLQQKMNLPNEAKVKDPNGKIRKPIENAVELINYKEKEANTNNFKISLVVKKDLPIKEYLDKGYIKVNVAGDFKDHYTAISKKQNKIIEANTKKQEARKEKALLQKEINKLKNK